MSTILLTWELGGGIGHLMNLRPIGQAFAARGHRVIAALRDISQARETFADTGIEFIPAPLTLRPGPRPYDPVFCFAHLLANIGFASESSLQTLFAAWNTLFDLVRPDLVIADHSPSALLALRGRNIPTVNVGIGFFAPPDASPLPYWLPNPAPSQVNQFVKDEQSLLYKVNALLESHHRPSLPHLSRLYADLTDNILATYAEFDHFAAQRAQAQGPAPRFWGHWPHGIGQELLWPAGIGPKIYAYLKAFPGLEGLLADLRQRAHPTVVFAPSLERPLLEKFAGPTLRFERKPLDLQQVADQCDLAIMNANHGTACTLLLAGKPCLLLPLFTEQMLFAQCVEGLGAGLTASISDPAQIRTGLERLLSESRFRTAAEIFRDRYANRPAGAQLPELVAYLESLLSVGT